ncbi:MaoC family dehydratase [Cucumibacter marinus]|uniref:MaoC family dehydratase n=1 Tax=Cucumibacter marinus TaxID=1121252 RepID=UPI000412AB8A|nr:MaoC family dehydratase [Cucumibacter marinus]
MTDRANTVEHYYEDLTVGQQIALGERTIGKQEIFAFAREYDPLPFHLDEKAAKESLLGGLASSGWQTAGFALGLFVEAFLGKAASMGGLGFRDLKWKRPFMVNDTLTGTVTVTDLRRSRSRPEVGIATFEFDMCNQQGKPLMSMSLVNLIGLRDPGSPIRDDEVGDGDGGEGADGEGGGE